MANTTVMADDCRCYTGKHADVQGRQDDFPFSGNTRLVGLIFAAPGPHGVDGRRTLVVVTAGVCAGAQRTLFSQSGGRCVAIQR